MTKIAPDHEAIRSLISQGLSASEISVELNLPRPLIDIAMGDATAPVPRPSFMETLPWDVAAEHARDEDARMLRLEQRRRAGESIDGPDLTDLQGWRNRLEDSSAVVTYSPATGFIWAPRTAADRDILRAS